MKKLSYLLTLLLILAPLAHVTAQSQKNADAAKKAAAQSAKNLDHVKKSVARLGVGSKAKATITLHDDTKVRGYVYSVGDEDFVIRDRKTDAPTTIRYADVYKVNDNRGHRNAELASLFVAIGAVVTIVAVIAAIKKND